MHKNTKFLTGLAAGFLLAPATAAYADCGKSQSRR